MVWIGRDHYSQLRRASMKICLSKMTHERKRCKEGLTASQIASPSNTHHDSQGHLDDSVLCIAIGISLAMSLSIDVEDCKYSLSFLSLYEIKMRNKSEGNNKKIEDFFNVCLARIHCIIRFQIVRIHIVLVLG